MPVEYLSRFDGDSTTRHTFPFTFPPGSGRETRNPRPGRPVSYPRGRRNFFLVKYDGRGLARSPGRFREHSRISPGRGPGRRRDSRLQTPPGTSETRATARNDGDRQRRSSSSPTRMGIVVGGREVAIPRRFSRSGTPPHRQAVSRPVKASLTLM